MKIHRFIGDFDLSQPHILVRDPELAKQMRSVLKLRTGEKVVLSNGRGDEVLCELGGYGNDSVSVTVLERLSNDAEPQNRSVLYCAVLKRENFEYVAQKATEVGVKEIVPVLTRRTVKLNLKHERLEKIIREAAEQSGRALVPVLREPMNLEDAFDHAQTNAFNYFFDRSGDRLLQVEATPRGTGLFIGPEGGWDESEVAAARDRGLPIVSLGTLTFRAETAAVIATYLFS